MAENKKKTTHIALQGGGAHGAFTWGVLDKILEDGRIELDGISATSAGSMNAVSYAYGKMHGGNEGAREKLHEFWSEISQTNIFEPLKSSKLYEQMKKAKFHMLDTFTHSFSPYQYNPYNFNLVKDTLEKVVDVEELQKCNNTKLFISATNVRTGQVRVFDNTELSMDVVLASSTLPYLFQAVKVGDEYYWDGGYMGNPPIFPLFYYGDTTDVMIVHINPIKRSNIPKSAHEITNRINEITFNSSLLKEFRAINFVHKLLEQGWIKEEYRHKLRNILVHSIRADQALHDFDVSSKFDTDWEFLTYLRDLGRSEAANWIEKNYNNINNRSTVDLEKEFFRGSSGGGAI